VSTAQRRIERATARVARLVRRDPLLAGFVSGSGGGSGDGCAEGGTP
jgi:hypothetical protein